MKTSTAVLLRFVISLAIAMVGAWVVNEGSYRLLKDPSARDEARRVELVIPAGTAERVAAGEDVLSLPREMAFVEGDLLVVKNQDSVSHQLGPVWVPPLSSGVLEVGQANDYSYSCTFQTSQEMGIKVNPRLTPSTRIQGTLAIGLPSAVMIGLYSFLVFPLKPKAETA